jgi:hypothetical protein
MYPIDMTHDCTLSVSGMSASGDPFNRHAGASAARIVGPRVGVSGTGEGERARTPLCDSPFSEKNNFAALDVGRGIEKSRVLSHLRLQVVV